MYATRADECRGQQEHKGLVHLTLFSRRSTSLGEPVLACLLFYSPGDL